MEKCKTVKKLIWLILFRRFIDDGFGITKGNRKDFEYWVSEFNLLRNSIKIDKYSYGGRKVEFINVLSREENFMETGKIKIHLFSKKRK